MSANNVLVFGPTGGVGRAAAFEANKRGAHVWLAMRDTSKAIPGLSEEEKGYSRVQADLSDPSSLKAAVQQSGATSAFVYTIHRSSDHMRASFSALKEAGITYITLLSSFSVQGSASESANHALLIPRMHAQTEVALEETGVASTVLRPGYFNTNVLWNKAGIQSGEVELLYPTVIFDFISPEDIGRVAGALIVKGQATKPLFLCGPTLYSLFEGYGIIAKTLGKEINIKENDEAREYEKLSFLPKAAADSLVVGLRENVPPNSWYAKGLHDEAVENIKTYGGFEPTKLEEWVEKNKAAFA